MMEVKRELKNNFDVKGGFDELSEFYDSDELRFFLDSSKLMVKELDLTGVKNILDVATGTGHTAIEMAKIIPYGSITGIDISRSMLEKAEFKRGNLSNVEFKQHDMTFLELLYGKYDLITCSFGTYFAKDMVQFFKSVFDKLTEDGKIVLLNFAEESFMPYGMLFVKDLGKMGFFKEFPPSFSIQNRRCLDSLNMAKFENVKIIEKQLQYTIKNPAEWWKIIWGTACRSFLADLSLQDIEVFKDYHLKKIKTMIDEGINTYKVNILIIIGTK